MRVLVVGGTGFYGSMIAAELAARRRFEVAVAGRCRPPGERPFVELDLEAADLALRLADFAPDLVVHCAGPYRAGRYALVEAALACGSHYLDLAEDRDYVLGIERFATAARARRLVVLSGVSSIPALSSAVLAAHRREFRRILAVDVGISAPQRLPGLSAVRGVLEQCGQQLPDRSGVAFADARWVELPQPVGRRVLARCDAPDLGLLPLCVPGLHRVTFRAGVASPVLMGCLRWFARCRQRGLFANAGAWARWATAVAWLFRPFGNGASGMYVRISGPARDGEHLVVTWQLTARDLLGVRVPAQGVLAMAERLARGAVETGARPCYMELTVDEYLDGAAGLTTGVTRLRGAAACADEARWR